MILQKLYVHSFRLSYLLFVTKTIKRLRTNCFIWLRGEVLLFWLRSEVSLSLTRWGLDIHPTFDVKLKFGYITTNAPRELHLALLFYLLFYHYLMLHYINRNRSVAKEGHKVGRRVCPTSANYVVILCTIQNIGYQWFFKLFARSSISRYSY